MTYGLAELAKQMSSGILAFPATAFDDGGALELERTAGQISDLAKEQPALLVSGGGAGEMFSLDEDEFLALTQVAVANAGELPMVAGIGHGVASARKMARLAEAAGADGVLLFPPYLMAPDQDGLFEYIGAVCRSTGIGVVAYSRNNGVLTAATALRLAEAHPNFLGVKDGVGDFETMLALRHNGGDRLVLVNGVPTAEVLAQQCFSLGIKAYSSAVFTFLPRVAKRFYAAVDSNDVNTIDLLMRDFYLPLIELRNRRPGHAVAIVKAGLEVTGRSAGRVRPPLHDLDADEMGRLEQLIDTANGIIER